MTTDARMNYLGRELTSTVDPKSLSGNREQKVGARVKMCDMKISHIRQCEWVISWKKCLVLPREWNLGSLESASDSENSMIVNEGSEELVRWLEWEGLGTVR
jgi:hypothetical protein